MREDLLHFVWKHGKFPQDSLVTTTGEPIEVVSLGTHNHLSGPDFFNAQLRISGQLWAGNVEVHIRSSHWYAHKHETDAKYANVILHVVWEHDREIVGGDGNFLPTLQLRDHIPEALLDRYERLFKGQRKTDVNCRTDIRNVPEFLFQNWLDRLYLERLEGKSTRVEALLKASHNNWEQVLFVLMMERFGSKINGPHFHQVATHIPFVLVRKLYGQPLQMEALFMGMAGLLERGTVEDEHYLALQREFRFLKHKYGLELPVTGPPEFFGLRPANFPTVRLAQLAAFYAHRQNVFQTLMDVGRATLADLFAVPLLPYWDHHYNFGKPSRKQKKRISARFLDLLVINVLAPLGFCHARHLKGTATQPVLDQMEAIAAEQNSILKKYADLGVPPANAKEAQAMLQLYQQYCTQNKCLQCAVGAQLLQGKS
ncbi:DUF2851 family protein [Maribacter sp. 2307ULW6-5]|uniref:DUF2851 family protein n=1 Tax=Maribacter sp. 2307ULW6-5 TaxID=3386275 RepID=UPI0039BD7218